MPIHVGSVNKLNRIDNNCCDFKSQPNSLNRKLIGSVNGDKPQVEMNYELDKPLENTYNKRPK